jgi:hypothetical protein
MARILCTFSLLLFIINLTAQTTLVPYNSTWKYLDNGTNQGTAWRGTSFNDAGWASGAAQLGYGDGDEATVVSYGSNANKKYITTYFRKTITVADASIYSGFTLNLKRDDGVVVYINGTERFRSNMPTGTVSYTTKAATDATDDGNTPQTISLAAGILATGNNVIAVEIHQRTANSTDISFDLELIGNTVPPVCNAPTGLTSSGITTTAATVSWTAVSGAVSYDVDYKINTSSTWINAATATTATSVNLSGLTEATLYDWRVRTNCSSNSSSYVTAQFTTQSVTPPPSTLIAYSASWKYLDNGSNQGTAWIGTSFNDAGWASGVTQLGYGDGDEATVVSYGSDANNKYITTYFRKTISVSDPNAYTSFTANVKRDDGVAVYINGTEVYRNNLTAGAAYNTLATLASDDGATAQTFTLLPSAFIAGNNVIAVEIHQSAVNSSDISFDLEIKGNTGVLVPVITRGPYLQMGNETAVSIRWRTDIASDSRIQIGTMPGGNDIAVVNDAASLTEHELRVTGLSADTKYYYTVGTSTAVIQGDAANYFRTVPPASVTRKISIAAFGDCGINSLNHQSGSLTAYRNYLTANNLEAADAWILLGDNAYSNGTDAEFTSNFFNPYGSTILKNHKLYPSPGNHDYAQSASRQADHNLPYYSMFTLPANAECGGVTSGTEHYFSYDIGNVHFISLNSYGKEDGGTTRMYDTLGAQAVWVKQDLAANTKPWVIAYWHHPPYTMGSHNSDTETELINIRQNFIRILERYGVDLILTGHSHDYERSYLLDGYYGNESSFNIGTHAKSSSSGKYDGSANSCPYLPVTGANHGTVYVLSGSAGASGGTQSGYPHNAMPWSINDGGMTYIEIEGNRLDQKFIRMDGTIWDKFSIMKDVNKTTDLNIASGTPTTLTASWPSGTYSWSTGETTRSITVSPSSTTTYTVKDFITGTCVTDVFNVTVGGAGRFINTTTDQTTQNLYSLKVLPTVVKKGQSVTVQTNTTDATEAALVDVSGRIIQTYKFTSNTSITTSHLQAGVYFLRLVGNKKSETQKFVVVE